MPGSEVDGLEMWLAWLPPESLLWRLVAEHRGVLLRGAMESHPRRRAFLCDPKNIWELVL
jgi:hypothetical protein